MTNKTEQTEQTENKEFTSTQEAFAYFVEKIYPNLSPAEKNKIKVVIHYFQTGKRNVPNKRLENIMSEYGGAKVEKIVKISF